MFYHYMRYAGAQAMADFLPTVVVAVAVYANSFNIHTVTDCAADALGRTKYNTCFVPPKLVHKHTLIIEIHSSSDSSTLK
jgi:hypothetical protein